MNAIGSAPGRSGARPTIGVLIDWIEGKYHSAVCAGLEAAARVAGANLIYFPGGSLKPPRLFEAQRNVLYDFVSPTNVDGLVLMSGPLSNYISPSEFADFYTRYRALPMVSIALALDGLPSVLVDNAAGMRQLLNHLIEFHGYRRLAFIQGPPGNADAEQRYRIYAEVLAEHGLELNPDLIVPGYLTRAGALEAMQGLLDNYPNAFDAVVAVNDEMAVGVLEALQLRDLRVPEQMAVVGFDDIKDARFVTPSLTTMRQPLYQQGWQAMEALLAVLRGERVPDQVTLATTLIIRRSCGCSEPAPVAGSAATAPSTTTSAQQTALSVSAQDAAPDRIYWELQSERQTPEILHEVGQVLITAFDMEHLKSVIHRELRGLGIKRCHLAMYTGQGAPTEWARLILAYDESGRLNVEADLPPFLSRALAPPGWLPAERYTLILEALYFGEEQFGFALFEAGPSEGIIYEVLSVQISSALKGALLVQQVQNHAATLETEVAARTLELTLANEQLQREIIERKRAEAELAHQAQKLAETQNRLAEVREMEQLRMAQDLHDGAVQQLIGISYEVETLRRWAGDNLPAGPRVAELDAALQQTRQQMLEVSKQLRGLISELRPPGLKELGLLQALEGYVGHLERDLNSEAPAILLDLPSALPPLPEVAAICIFRVAQEALRNSLQHADAQRISVHLTCSPNEVIFSVSDDGSGFQMPAHFSELTQDNHFGLAGIAERVAWSGGQLVICSEKGRGTEVSVTLPLSNHDKVRSEWVMG
jgi:DNA-binding LacI/PurR family transcriptional regulator/signal transduction histidine kinase